MRLKNNRGYVVLITVLVMGVVVSTIAAFLLIAGTNASVASLALEAGVQARAAVNGCAELALDSIQANPTLSTPSTGWQTIDPSTQAVCGYTIIGNSPNYTISATGYVRQNEENYVQRLTITTTQTTPNVNVSSWQDTP